MNKIFDNNLTGKVDDEPFKPCQFELLYNCVYLDPLLFSKLEIFGITS